MIKILMTKEQGLKIQNEWPGFLSECRTVGKKVIVRFPRSMKVEKIINLLSSHLDNKIYLKMI